MTIEQVDALDRDDFVGVFGEIFEHSPWVAERAWQQRPFRSLGNLCAQMRDRVDAASRGEQLALIRAHPDLGTRAKVGQSSASEQASAGLDRLTVEEYDRLVSLNTAYKQRFQFPFIFAVKGSGKHAILAALDRRLHSTPEEEFAEALRQIYRIACFRLEMIIEET
jgi:OHCU decarboxylase